MNFPAGGAVIVQALCARHFDLARGDDNQRRTLTLLIAQTFAARFGSQWGTKATTINHPQSKDALAYRNPDGAVDVWDWQNGNTREPQVRDGQPPHYPDARATLNGPRQWFIEVKPIDHLAPAPAEPAPAPAEPAPPPAPPAGGTPAPGSPAAPAIDAAALAKLADAIEKLAASLAVLNVNGLRVRL